MIPISIGDLSSSLSSRLEMSRVKNDVKTLSTELATGLRSDISDSQKGDYSRVSALERALEISDRYKLANSDTALVLDTAQRALDSIQGSVSRTAPQFLISSSDFTLGALSASSDTAKRELASIIGALNTDVGGRALFGGTETGTSPVRNAEVLISTLSAEIAGALDVADALSRIDNWFSDPVNGFDAVMYRPGASSPLELPSAESRAVVCDTQANDPEIKNTLKALSIAALAADPIFAGDPDAQRDMLQLSAEKLLGNEAELAKLRGNIGALQETVENDAIALDTEKFAFQLALNDIYAADPYETASKLDAAALQLEMIFNITSRLSNLSLSRYL